MQLFNGKQQAKELDKTIQQTVTTLGDLTNTKVLLIINISNTNEIPVYVKMKTKVCERLGIATQYINISSNLNDNEILQKVRNEINKENVASAIIQLPLPRTSLEPILLELPLTKDIDVLNPTTRKQTKKTHLAPVVRAVNHFLNFYNLPLNLSISMIGDGYLVGQPLIDWFKSNGAEVDVYNINNPVNNVPLKSKLVISATGIPKLLKGDNMAGGTSLIDYGSSYSDTDKKIIGDFDLESKIDHLKFISPSPGGMGPLVVRYLILNHLDSYIM